MPLLVSLIRSYIGNYYIGNHHSMNNSSTLHQLISPPSTWASIDEIVAVWQTQDSLVLLAEAAQGYDDARLKSFKTIYILQADADVLGLNQSTDHNVEDRYQILTYDDWATLILKHNKHISWK